MNKLTHWQHSRNNPSFSSSLLDAIYRSIDEPDATSPQSALSPTSKNCTPKPPPAANFHRHFSSDSTARPHPIPHSDPPPEPKTPSSIRSRLRNLRNLRAPASPAPRLAAFLNAVFAGGGGKPKKPKLDGGPELSKGGREKRCSGEAPMRDRRMLVEELLRGLNVEEEESDCESESSSELFELESLSAIGRLRDGLPVYETTNLAANRAIHHGFIV